MCNFEGRTRQLLTIPPYFVPYMEKHRLYEFFYVIDLYHLVPLKYFIEINYAILHCVAFCAYFELYYNICYYITFYCIVLYHKKFVGISDAITDPATRGPNSIYKTVYQTHCTKARYSQSCPYSSSKLR